jgi:hypothetical protein
MCYVQVPAAKSAQIVVIPRSVFFYWKQFSNVRNLNAVPLLGVGPRQLHELTRITLGVLEYLNAFVVTSRVDEMIISLIDLGV